MANEESYKEQLNSDRAKSSVKKEAIKRGTQMAAAKGTQAAGKGTQMAGKAIGGAGQKLTATKYGAVLGVPLQAVGKGMEAGGKGAETAGKRMAQKGEQGTARQQGLEQMMQPGGMGGQPSPVELLKKGGAENYLRNLSAEALRQSWLNLIDSWGLTFIYIFIHFLGHYMGGPLSSFFCKFGEEGAFGFMPKKYQAVIGVIEGKTGVGETIDAGSEYAELVAFGVLLGLVVLILAVVFIIFGGIWGIFESFI